MVLKFRVLNATQLEASIRTGAKAYSKAVFKEIEKATRKWSEDLIRSIEKDSKFSELKNSTELRGQLGLAVPEFRSGGDTDADHLIRELNTYKLTKVVNNKVQKIAVRFPTLNELEVRLTRSLSRVSKGTVSPGPTQSWFRWWEFGDRGEIDTLTVTRSTLGRATRGGTSRKTIQDLIKERSRSRAAIQIPSLPSIGVTISGRSLIRSKYDAFARIFPAAMSKALRRFVRGPGKNVNKFFVRARIS